MGFLADWVDGCVGDDLCSTAKNHHELVNPYFLTPRQQEDASTVVRVKSFVIEQMVQGGALVLGVSVSMISKGSPHSLQT